MPSPDHDPPATPAFGLIIIGDEILSGKRADKHLPAVIERLRARGLQPGQCEAYVYGGGNMFPRVYPQQSIGTRNVDWVLDALAATGVRVLQHDVGGNTYRRLRWTVGSDAPTVTAMPI